MESISKKTGKIFTGKLAALMVKIGVATSLEDGEPIEEAENIIEEPVEEQTETTDENIPEEVEESVEELLPDLEEKAEEQKTADQETEKVNLIKSGQSAKKPTAKKKPVTVKKASVKRVKK